MTFKEYVRSQLLTMSEFRQLDPVTQAKWREIHQRKNREEQIEMSRCYKEMLKEWEMGSIK